MFGKQKYHGMKHEKYYNMRTMLQNRNYISNVAAVERATALVPL